jgi:hypothetical protein
MSQYHRIYLKLQHIWYQPIYILQYCKFTTFQLNGQIADHPASTCYLHTELTDELAGESCSSKWSKWTVTHATSCRSGKFSNVNYAGCCSFARSSQICVSDFEWYNTWYQVIKRDIVYNILLSLWYTVWYYWWHFHELYGIIYLSISYMTSYIISYKNCDIMTDIIPWPFLSYYDIAKNCDVIHDIILLDMILYYIIVIPENKPF